MVVSDKAKNIDPNLFVLKWFEYKSTGIEEFEIGRGIKKFTGQIDFSFRSVTDPKKSLLSQSENIANFLTHKWDNELHYKLKKYLWSFTDNRISVRFEYEWQDATTKQWKRTHGNEHWEFDSEGLMRIRDMSANDISIKKEDRKY